MAPVRARTESPVPPRSRPGTASGSSVIEAGQERPVSSRATSCLEYVRLQSISGEKLIVVLF